MNLPLIDAVHASELQLTKRHQWAAKDLFVLYAAVAVLIAFGIGILSGKNIFGDRDASYEVTANIGPPPTVEPLVLKNVSRDVAKVTNDAVPVSAKPVPAAAPFFFRGSDADRARATDCLAATIFYEAGAEHVGGQMAVVQVVLNRARHPGYPKSVCAVVFQGHERRTGCQFSYTCDGSMRRRPSADSWARYRGIASAMLNGLVYAPVGLATHYHTDWVLPAWSARLEKIRVERSHLFFRYAGYWGSPKAYRTTLSGIEPGFSKLAGLSPAHAKVAPPEPAAPLPGEEVKVEEMENAVLPEIAPIPSTVSTTLEPEDKTKDTYIIYVDPLLEPAALTSMAENACQGRGKCKVLAWADQDLMPRGLPIEPSARAAMAFSYVRAGKGKGRSKWNCALFPRDSKSDCL